MLSTSTSVTTLMYKLVSNVRTLRATHNQAERVLLSTSIDVTMQLIYKLVSNIRTLIRATHNYPSYNRPSCNLLRWVYKYEMYTKVVPSSNFKKIVKKHIRLKRHETFPLVPFVGKNKSPTLLFTVRKQSEIRFPIVQ